MPALLGALAAAVEASAAVERRGGKPESGDDHGTALARAKHSGASRARRGTRGRARPGNVVPLIEGLSLVARLGGPARAFCADGTAPPGYVTAGRVPGA